MITIKASRPKDFYLRQNKNPDHHLWLNRNVWNFKYTEQVPADPLLKPRRINKSLHTKDLKVARQRRDEYIKLHNIYDTYHHSYS